MSKKKNRARNTAAPDIYIALVSGGKDSQLVLSNAVREHGAENVRAVHNFTGIDHSLTYQHLKYMEALYGVKIEHTANAKYKDMWDLLDKRNAIPSRVVRFCTDELKVQALNQWLAQFNDATLRRMVVLMGMRSGESQNRSNKYGELGPDDLFNLKDMNPKTVLAKYRIVRVRLPIVNLSDNEVFDTLRNRGEKVNPLYARGHKRVGCYPCILAGKRDYRMASRDPEGRETVIKLANFKDLIVAAKNIERPEILIDHDLDKILDEQDQDPFGFNEPDDAAGGCQWCAM